MDTPTATVETPAPASVPADLEAYRASKATRETSPTITTPVIDDAPDPEVEADPELRKAIDEIEAPRAEETPQEKRARTLKHKDAARKGYNTRLQNKASREAERADQLAREVEALRRQVQTPPAGSDAARASQPAPLQAETDPTDPEPDIETWAAKHSFEDFAAKHPTLRDPYAAWQAEFGKEWGRWDRRNASREAEKSQRDATQRQQAHELNVRVAERLDTGRAVHADYDATVGALGKLLGNVPAADQLVATAIADIADKKVAGEVLYRLGKSLDETRGVITNPTALLRLMGRLEAAVTATGNPSPAAHPVVTSAPDPHTPVGAAAITGATFDPAATNSLADYRRAKAEGRLPRS